MVVPLLDIVRGEVPRTIGIDGLAVSTHDGIDILGTTRTALDLEDTHMMYWLSISSSMPVSLSLTS